MSLTLPTASELLAKIVEPLSGQTLGSLGIVSDLEVEGGRVDVTLRRLWHGYSRQGELTTAVDTALRGAGATHVELGWETELNLREILPDDPCPSVKNILLVMSGKGGVGKSTVACNIALALARAGAKVGLLDADMYGPSIPTMLGVMGRPISADGKKMLPLTRFGVELMSIGFLLEDPKQAVVWRGPMLQGALMQFLKDVEWGALDYLVLDLPPGTGDIVLTISQKMRTSGAIVVTTPQAVALQDVYKSVSMAQKVGIAVLGVVENESYFICDGCDKRHELFGAGGGASIAEFAEAPLLGQIPIELAVREWGDAGTPVVQAAPESAAAIALAEVAERLAARVAIANAGRGATLSIDRSGGTNRRLPIAH